MSVKASATNVRMSPRKVGEVAALVRGRTVADALVILEHTPRRAALPVSKLITSAAANASNNHGMKEDGLVISHISVGPGFALKRYRPAAHGRALPYKKQSSNIEVVLDGQVKPKKTAKAKTSGKKDSKTEVKDSDNKSDKNDNKNDSKTEKETA